MTKMGALEGRAILRRGERGDILADTFNKNGMYNRAKDAENWPGEFRKERGERHFLNRGCKR